MFFNRLLLSLFLFFIPYLAIADYQNHQVLSPNILKIESITSFYLESFLKYEWLKPSSINFHYWVYIFWTSIVKVFYIFSIFWIIFLFFIWSLNIRNSFYLVLSLFLVISFKNFFDYSKIYFTWFRDFHLADDWNKKFHNMFDYYEFTQKSRMIMWIDKTWKEKSCKFYWECFSSRPYCSYWKSTFLRPCNYTSEISDADYILLFKRVIPEDLKRKEILYTQNKNYLLKN